MLDSDLFGLGELLAFMSGNEIPDIIREYKGNSFDFSLKNGEAVLLRAVVETNTVYIPDTVTDDSGVQYHVTKISGFSFNKQQKLKHLIIPEGVTMIGVGAFDGCGSVLSVVMPTSIKELKNVFRNCPTIEDNTGGLIYYTGTMEQWKMVRIMDDVDYTPFDQVVRFVDKDFEIPEIDFCTTYDEDSDKEISLIRFSEQGGEIVIPETYTDEKGVTHKITYIGRSAFSGNPNLTKVTIPATIETICQDAFYGCSSLKAVVISESDDVLNIEMGAFFKCKNLEKIIAERPCCWGKYSLLETDAQLIGENQSGDIPLT